VVDMDRSIVFMMHERYFACDAYYQYLMCSTSTVDCSTRFYDLLYYANRYEPWYDTKTLVYR
jgi:hypothetical protein